MCNTLFSTCDDLGKHKARRGVTNVAFNDDGWVCHSSNFSSVMLCESARRRQDVVDRVYFINLTLRIDSHTVSLGEVTATAQKAVSTIDTSAALEFLKFGRGSGFLMFSFYIFLCSVPRVTLIDEVPLSFQTLPDQWPHVFTFRKQKTVSACSNLRVSYLLSALLFKVQTIYRTEKSYRLLEIIVTR